MSLYLNKENIDLELREMLGYGKKCLENYVANGSDEEIFYAQKILDNWKSQKGEAKKDYIQTKAQSPHVQNNNYGRDQYNNNYINSQRPEDNSSKRSREEELARNTSEKKSKTSNSLSAEFIGSESCLHPSTLCEVWQEYLYTTSHDEFLFYFSPEKFGIITCGDGIKNTRNMPEEEYKKLCGKADPINDCFKDFDVYIDSVLDAEIRQDMERAVRHISQKEDDMVPFLLDILLIFARDVFRAGLNVSHSEANCNDILFHLCLRCVANQFDEEQINFIAGEEPMRSMSKQIYKKFKVDDERFANKADGIITLKPEEGFNIETLILETSSAFNTASNTKKSFDHHKAAFGILSILKTLADEYEMGGIRLFSIVKIYFLHAYDNKLRLWSLSCNNKDVYILRKEWTVECPYLFNRRERELTVFINHIADIKKKLTQSVEAINNLVNNHKKQAKKHRRKPFPSDQLLSYIVNPSIIKLTEKSHSKGMHDQLPQSSPLGSQE